MGSAHPIVVQSMTNTDTADAAATAAQVRALHAAGSELVRVTVNTDEAARAVAAIVAEVDVPVIGDFHYNGHLLLTKYPDCARALAKYRINPGNVGTKRRDDNFRTIIQVAINEGKAVRIGVNWGSLDQTLLTRLMDENSRLPEPLDAGELLMRAQRENVTYLPGRYFTVSRPDPGGLRLSFAGLTPEKIRKGVSILGEIFSTELERTQSARSLDPAPAMV